MRRSHLAVGILAVICFLASGQYMRLHNPPMAVLEDGVRMMYRSRHIYLLGSGLVNLMLGLYLRTRASGWRKSTQTAGSILLLSAPLLLLMAFINEPSHGVRADLWQGSLGLFALFGGSLLHVLAGIGKASLANELGSDRSRDRQGAAIRTIVTIAGFACVSQVLAHAQTEHLEADFRAAVWGMTRAQVVATEPNRPVRVSESDGEIVLQYEASKLGALNCRPIYIFTKGKLVRARFVVEEEHGDQNEFIRDFHKAESVLKERYGQPKEERAIWEDDSTQQETKSYLDQDRSTPSSILPSDRFVGLAVALGHLRLYTIRDNGRTRVLHVLAGSDHQITHQIDYQAVTQ